MKKELAVEVSVMVDKLISAEERLKLFDNTKEFCEIKITGENGSESKYQINFNWRADKPDVNKVRTLIRGLLVAEIKILNHKISEL